MTRRLNTVWSKTGPLVLFFVICAWVAYLTLGPVNKATKDNRSQQQTLTALSPCLTKDAKGHLVPNNAAPECQLARDNAAKNTTPIQSCTFTAHAGLEIVIPSLGTFPVVCGRNIHPIPSTPPSAPNAPTASAPAPDRVLPIPDQPQGSHHATHHRPAPGTSISPTTSPGTSTQPNPVDQAIATVTDTVTALLNMAASQLPSLP